MQAQPMPSCGVCPSMCLSICLSRLWILSKWINISSAKANAEMSPFARTDARRTLIHRQSSRLLQWRSVRYLFISRPSTSDGSERCRPSGRRCWQIWTHLAGPSRRASLASSATANTVQDSNLCVWLCPWALSCLLQQLLHPSRRHFWPGKSSFGRTPRHACPFDKNTARLERASMSCDTHQVHDVSELKQHPMKVWHGWGQSVVDATMEELHKRFQACIRAKGGQFEDLI